MVPSLAVRAAVTATLCVAAAAPAAAPAQSPAGGPPSAPVVGAAIPTDTLRAPALAQPVTLLRDRAGVVHIRAATEHDLFFAQGWSVARDRLFQLELWRRRATGTMAELLGPRALPTDRATRMFRYRGDADADFAVYHPRGKAIVQAFVDGINAYIALTEREPARLPPEFGLLRTTPGRWTPAVVVSRHNGLFDGADDEIATARLVAAVGADTVRTLSALGPRRVSMRAPGIDAAAAPAESLAAFFRALRGSVPLVVAGDAPTERGTDASAPASPAWQASQASQAAEAEPMPEGSNNWAVSGLRTASGKPILANDPHRVIAVPSLRYFVHLEAPGWRVIGGGEPALPGVAIGHNGAGAWGLTIFALDAEDLYELDVDPRDASRYRFRGGWRRFTDETHVIPVRGAAADTARLRFSHHGPVIATDRRRHKAWALRSTAFEPGTAPYLASLRYAQARTWTEFRAASTHAFAPAENMVWADTSGTIGWQVVGKAPRRLGHDGLVPVPGDGRFEWAGFLPVAELPHAVNPPRGFLHTANENNVPAGYPHLEAVGTQWADPYRADRIAAVLDTTRAATPASMGALQYDAGSRPAEALVPLLAGWAPEAATVRTARDLVLAWDRMLAPGSVGAGIYQQWQRELMRAAPAVLWPPAAGADAPRLPLSVVVRWATAPGAAGVARRDAIVRATFAAAVDTLTRRFGRAPEGWHWGQARYHHVALPHVLSPLLDPAARARWDLPALPMGGGGSTPWATGDADRQQAGASFRVVIDLADVDRSLATNTPGQSGDPRSPYYRNLYEPWATGRFFPLVFTPAAVAREAETTTVLRP
jgi:penicillin amidase